MLERDKCKNTDITGIDSSAKIIRKILETEGLSQQQLADKMGVARQNVNQILTRDGNGMRYDKFLNMVNILGYEIIIRKKI